MEHQIATYSSVNILNHVKGKRGSPWKTYSRNCEKMRFWKMKNELDKERKGHCSHRDEEQHDPFKNCKCTTSPPSRFPDMYLGYR